MKLYGYPGAPNPRKVAIFLAEKAIDYEFVNVNLAKGEQRSDPFLQKTLLGKIPVLETDDGKHLSAWFDRQRERASIARVARP